MAESVGQEHHEMPMDGSMCHVVRGRQQDKALFMQPLVNLNTVASIAAYMYSIRDRFNVSAPSVADFQRPSRVIRQRDSNMPVDGPPPSEVLDAMRSYADGQQVQEMLHILLTRLLEAQPLDPFEFLIQTLEKDEQLDALEKKAGLRRLDLRREKTKKQLVVQLYQRLVELQRTQHKDKLEAQAPHLARGFLTAQLRLEETRSHIRKQFPSHYRDLIAYFIEHEEETPAAIPLQHFTETCMQVLRTRASA